MSLQIKLCMIIFIFSSYYQRRIYIFLPYMVQSKMKISIQDTIMNTNSF